MVENKCLNLFWEKLLQKDCMITCLSFYSRALFWASLASMEALNPSELLERWVEVKCMLPYLFNKHMVKTALGKSDYQELIRSLKYLPFRNQLIWGERRWASMQLYCCVAMAMQLQKNTELAVYLASWLNQHNWDLLIFFIVCWLF